VLDVRPAGLRNGRHVEAVAIGNEGRLVLGKAIELALAFEVLPEAIRTHFSLRDPDAWRYSDL
jgi:hypothetical protein